MTDATEPKIRKWRPCRTQIHILNEIGAAGCIYVEKEAGLLDRFCLPHGREIDRNRVLRLIRRGALVPGDRGLFPASWLTYVVAYGRPQA